MQLILSFVDTDSSALACTDAHAVHTVSMYFDDAVLLKDYLAAPLVKLVADAVVLGIVAGYAQIAVALYYKARAFRHTDTSICKDI